jgi:hypothetical protein
MTFDSLLRKCFAIALLLISHYLYGQGDRVTGSGLSPLPLHPFITGTGFRDCFINQAALAWIEDITAGIEYHSRFGMADLAVKSLFITVPHGKGSVGFRYSGYGFSELSIHSFSLSAGIPLSSNLAIGAEAGVETAVSPSLDAAKLSASGQAGMIWKVTESTSIGIHLVNPFPGSQRLYSSPSAIRAGVSSAAGYKVSVSAVLEKSSRRSLSMASGISYDLNETAPVRAGFDTGTGSLGFTVIFRFAGFTSSVSFLTHNRLGISPVAAVIRNFGR